MHPAALSDRYANVPVLVLGASGFVGRSVARVLTDAGAELHMGARDPQALQAVCKSCGIVGQIHRVDLAQRGAVTDLVRARRPALVFNLVGYGVAPSERTTAIAESLNRDLPAELALACQRATGADWPGLQLVHAGTALEYGPVDGEVRETLPREPTTLYGRTKLAGSAAIEAVCQAGSLRAAVGHIFTAYGPGERLPRLLPTLLAARHHRLPLELTAGLQQRDFVHVGDVAEALLRLGALPREGYTCVNVATGTLCSVREFVETAAEVLGLDPTRLRFGTRPYLPEEMWHGPVAVDTLRSHLGWIPGRSVRDGIGATARTLAACGPRTTT